MWLLKEGFLSKLDISFNQNFTNTPLKFYSFFMQTQLYQNPKRYPSVAANAAAFI